MSRPIGSFSGKMLGEMIKLFSFQVRWLFSCVPTVFFPLGAFFIRPSISDRKKVSRPAPQEVRSKTCRAKGAGSKRRRKVWVDIQEHSWNGTVTSVETRNMALKVVCFVDHWRGSSQLVHYAQSFTPLVHFISPLLPFRSGVCFKLGMTSMHSIFLAKCATECHSGVGIGLRLKWHQMPGRSRRPWLGDGLKNGWRDLAY